MGLRERKKLETRQAISDVATRLFAQRGFEHVTVAEVAGAAGVSEKTVFNYFGSKEDLLFDEVPAFEAALVDAVRNRKPGEPVIAALHRQQETHVERFASREFASFARVIEESPALRAKELEVQARFVRVLAEALREELGVDDLDARVAASLVMGVQWQFFLLARERALAGKHGPAAARRLRADLARGFATLARGLGDLG